MRAMRRPYSMLLLPTDETDVTAAGVGAHWRVTTSCGADCCGTDPALTASGALRKDDLAARAEAAADLSWTLLMPAGDLLAGFRGESPTHLVSVEALPR